MRENFNRIKRRCESLLAQRVVTLVDELEGTVRALGIHTMKAHCE
jgi:hypothetical protein